MRYLLLILALNTTPPAFAGWYVGNGGDTIECKPSPANDLNGLYALDYILTLTDLKGDDGLAKVASWQASSERLQKILTSKVPLLAQSFKEFAELVFNKDYKKTRVWESAPFGLIKLDDQRITSLLPANCHNINGEFQITQAVIRQHEEFSGTMWDHYIYKYAPDILSRLETEAPVQLSYLLVHEWLWDISNNVDRNRRINRFLHSRAIENMAPAEVEATLKGMGLVMPEKLSDVWDPEVWQGYPVTKEQFFSRFTGDSRMANLGQLRVDRRVRDMDCEEGDTWCDPNWRKEELPYPIDPGNARFFLSPTWRFASQKEFPLKIVSPELIALDKQNLLQGMGEIECRFVNGTDPKDGNLECRFQRPGLIHPLFNLYSVDELPMENWPKMRANLTEECFRLLVRSGRKTETVTKGKTGMSKQIMETVFTLRLKWRP